MKNDFKYIVDNSKYVRIDEAKIDDFVQKMDNIKYQHWSHEYDLKLNEKEWILLCLIIESMNFCFWKEPKWKVQHNNEIITGSNALFCSVVKEVKRNKEFLNLDYLNQLNYDNFIKIFEGIEGECPYLKKRYKNFKDSIKYLKKNDFYGEIFSIKSDIELINYIVSHFKSFDDKSIYKNKVIHFNKRATLLANDFYYMSPTIRENVLDMNHLSGCADYGIPRTFRDYGLMIYNDELASRVDNKKLIPHDSEMEIEIRGNMLYLIERIKEKLHKKGIDINSVELDNIIWLMGKKMKNRSNSHHTITIYY